MSLPVGVVAGQGRQDRKGRRGRQVRKGRPEHRPRYQGHRGRRANRCNRDHKACQATPGATGSQGPQGPQGATGATGPAGAPQTPSDTNPLIDGTAAPGTSLLYSRGDHRHPTDTSRAAVTYVDTQDALKADKTYVDSQDALKAPLASPTFTGDPKAPTPTAGDNDTSIATTAFVGTAITNAAVPPPATVAPLINGTAAVGTVAKYAKEDHVHPTDTTRAALTQAVRYDAAQTLTSAQAAQARANIWVTKKNYIINGAMHDQPRERDDGGISKRILSQ